MKFKIKDIVKVTAGKDKGRQGKILKTFPKLHQVLVEGVNMYKKHRKVAAGQAGGIMDLSKPLDVAKVALLCPNCSQPTRVGFEIDKEMKKKNRVCRKCGKVI